MQEIETKQVVKQIENNKKFLIGEVSDNLGEIFIKLEKAWTVSNALTSDYFSNTEEYYKDHPYFLIGYYENARILTEIVQEYLYDAKKELEVSQDRIEVLLNGGKTA